GDYGRHAATQPRRKLHQALNQTPAFRAGNEFDALVDRQRRSLTVDLVTRQAFEEATDGNVQGPADLVEHGCAHPVPGVFVFLELLKADAYGSGKLALRHVRLDANDGDLSADMQISRMWASLKFVLCPRCNRRRPFRLRQTLSH